MNIYLESIIKQATELVEELKQKDSTYHQTVNPISVYGELPVNLNCQYNLVELFKSKFEEEIKVTFVDEESFIKGFVMLFEGSREIFLTKDNTCWTRFYLCKELSQALIYDSDNTTTSSEDISNVLSELINTTNSENLQDQAETAPIFAAIEFLIPSNIVNNLLELKNKGFPNQQIAKKMLVPEQIVDFRLSTRGQEIFQGVL